MGCWQNAGEGFPIRRPARFTVANLQAPLQFRVFDATGENGQTTVATWSYAFVTSFVARLDARKTLFLLRKLTNSSGQGVRHHAGSGV